LALTGHNYNGDGYNDDYMVCEGIGIALNSLSLYQGIGSFVSPKKNQYAGGGAFVGGVKAGDVIAGAMVEGIGTVTVKGILIVKVEATRKKEIF
jgi:hypothetical protein